jgi:hypothetical protein
VALCALTACDEPAPAATASAPAEQGAPSAPSLEPPEATGPALPDHLEGVPSFLRGLPALPDDDALSASALATDAPARVGCAGGWTRVRALPDGAGHVLGRQGRWDLLVLDGRARLWDAGLEDPGGAPAQLREALARWKETCTPRTWGGEIVRLTCGDVHVRKVELRHYEVARDAPGDLDAMSLSLEGDAPLEHPDFPDVDVALVIGRDLDLRKWLEDVQFAYGPSPAATVCPGDAPASGVPTFDTKQLPAPEGE